MMYSILKPLLFKMDSEKAHTVTLNVLDYVPSWCFKKPGLVPVTAFGQKFAHPVGLAAGLDKNGDHLDALAKLGFSFIELGTVTPRPQAGNPAPRLFRLPQANAIINRMGFNNKGVDALVSNVKNSSFKGILGINIGKNKDTTLDNAAEDYIYCLRKTYSHASYVTINISSPNTPNLRQLQQGNFFSMLLDQLVIEQEKLAQVHQKKVPLLIKISPDETDETLKQMTDLILRFGIEGVIATNTTCSRSLVTHVPGQNEAGGLSGQPLYDLSLNCLKIIKQYVGDQVTLIGAGGIDSFANAKAKIDAGASLVQLYTGLIYQGPKLICDIVEGFAKQ